jgi:hypothetical protein
MSLVHTYVRAVDGQLYRDPVLRGDDWFICFDDDDPPEIVVAGSDREECAVRAHRLVASIGRNVRLHSSRSSRSFAGKFRQACAFWFDLTAPIPVPEGMNPVTKTDLGSCVIYDPKEKVQA